jgi:low affinity Fe/Cu permease
MATQTETLKDHEKQRDFFCVVSEGFRVFARTCSSMLGSAWVFASALLIIVVWLVTGPVFHFSDTWQLIIKAATTIVTFLMVFLIQNVLPVTVMTRAAVEGEARSRAIHTLYLFTVAHA